MDGQVDGLEAKAQAEAGEELIADPVGGRGVGLECGEEAFADGHDAGADDEGWGVVAGFLGEEAGHDGCHDEAEDEWKGVDARLDRVNAMGSLDCKFISASTIE